MSDGERLQTSIVDENNFKNMGLLQKIDNYKFTQLQNKYQWTIRILTPLLFVGTLLVNYFLGINKNKQVSDEFHLWVTPPGLFFAIWGVIYIALAIAIIYNFIRNQWSLKAHIFFALSNIMNIIWTFVFCQGTLTSIVFASFILFFLSCSILATWINLGDIVYPNDQSQNSNKYKIWTIIIKNIFAFYLGWCIAATNLNFGMDLVYWFGATKQQQMIVFWIFAPLGAIGVTLFNLFKYGKNGILACFCLVFSVAWAFSGAGITSYKCLNQLQTLC